MADAVEALADRIIEDIECQPSHKRRAFVVMELNDAFAAERERGRVAEERARRALLDRIENLERERGAAEAVQAVRAEVDRWDCMCSRPGEHPQNYVCPKHRILRAVLPSESEG